MQVLINTTLLKDSINKLLTIVDKKMNQQILSYALIKTQAEQNKLEIVGTDQEIYAKILIDAKILKEGSFCIHAKNFSEILREMPQNTEFNMEISDESNMLILSLNEIRFSLLISKTETYPILKFDQLSNYFTLNSYEFHKMISKISHAISNDESMVFLNGIFLQKIGTKLRAVATDGHRLALIDHSTQKINESLLEEGIIIPKKGVVEIKKMVDAFPDTELLISVDNSYIYLNSYNSYFLSIRLIAKPFPKYQNVIPSRTINKVTINRSNFISSAKRIKILASEESNGVFFLISNDTMIIKSQNSNYGDAEERINVTYQGPAVEICFNIRYIIDIVSIIDDEEFFIEFNNELGPFVIKMQSMPHFLSILMPIKR